VASKISCVFIEWIPVVKSKSKFAESSESEFTEFWNFQNENQNKSLNLKYPSR